MREQSYKTPNDSEALVWIYQRMKKCTTTDARYFQWQKSVMVIISKTKEDTFFSKNAFENKNKMISVFLFAGINNKKMDGGSVMIGYFTFETAYYHPAAGENLFPV